MAHPNLEERRRELARVTLKYDIPLNEPLLIGFARAFHCSPSTIRNDVKILREQAAAGRDRLWETYSVL